MVAFSRVVAFLFLASIFAFGNQIQAQVFDWQEGLELPEEAFLRDVAASPDRLIATGFQQTPGLFRSVAFTSIDGRTWEEISLVSDNVRIDEINFVKNTWLAARGDGNLQSSADGVEWTEIELPEDLQLVGNSIVELGEEVLVIGNGPRAARVIASSDLVNWQMRFDNASRPPPLFGPVLDRVASSGEFLIALAPDQPPSVPIVDRIWSSDDGSEWISSDSFAFDIAWTGERFKAIWLWEPALDSNPLGELSLDGTWQFPEFTAAAEERFRTIDADGSNMIMGSLFDRVEIIASANGGQSWTEQDVDDLQNLGAITEFVRWKNGWVGIGNSIIFGTPPEPQAVPAVSGWTVQVLGLLLVLIAFVGLRRSRV